MPTPAELLLEARNHAEMLTEIRRDLHQIPEFGLNLPNTQARILKSVAGLGEVILGEKLNSIVLRIKGGHPGPTVLLRADMDALAVQENSGETFSSTNGFMHACGHDLHMAGGIGAAHLLHAHREEMYGDVVIWFQPGEEGQGGADVMIAEGMLEAFGTRPVVAYGLHVFTSLPLGVVACKPGPMMASAGDLFVTFKGSGGHGSMPWLSKDPITPLLEAAGALQSMITKRFDAFDPVILNIGWIRAGDEATTNVIADQASFGATVRTFSKESREKLERYTADLLAGIASGFGLQVEHEFSPYSKVLMNDPDAVTRVSQVTRQMLGDQWYQNMPHPIAGGEDFASIVDEVPGAFLFLGACPPDIDAKTAPTNHAANARFDDSVLPQAAALLAALAFEHLRGESSVQ